MEVGNVQNIGPQKTDDLRETTRVRKDAVNAYAKVEKAEGDSVAVSSKAKLLHNLRENYDKTDEKAEIARVQELKDRIQQGTHELSAEEIVSSILRGSLFDVI
jgi:anti-sigma28 factor (negative regulator of flagellin synthesis)